MSNARLVASIVNGDATTMSTTTTHYRKTVATMDTDHVNAVVRSVVSRLVSGFGGQPTGASSLARRLSRLGQAEPEPTPALDEHIPVHFAQGRAELLSVSLPDEDPAADGLASELLVQAGHAPLRAHAERWRRLQQHLHPTGWANEWFTAASQQSPHDMQRLQRQVDIVQAAQQARQAGLAMLRLSTHTDPNQPLVASPRRLLQRAGETRAPAVLVDVSPFYFRPPRDSAVMDVPLGGGRADDSTAGEGGNSQHDAWRQQEDPVSRLQAFAQCTNAIHTEKQNAKSIAKCLPPFVEEAVRDEELLHEVLDALAPARLDQLRGEFPRAPQAMMAAAAAVGVPEAQQALCTLLLSMDQETPEVKSYVDAHDFFHVTMALAGACEESRSCVRACVCVHFVCLTSWYPYAELKRPTTATFDCMHQSLEQHAAHPDQYHQLLLAIGELARDLPRDHEQQERVRMTLERRLADVVSENSRVEDSWQSHLAAVDEVIADMPTAEWHMWFVLLAPAKIMARLI